MSWSLSLLTSFLISVELWLLEIQSSDIPVEDIQLHTLKISVNKVPKILSGSTRQLCHFWRGQGHIGGIYLLLYPFLKPHKRWERNLFEKFVSWSNNTFSNSTEIVGSTLTCLQFSLFNGSSLLNIKVTSAPCSSFEVSFF